MTDGSPARRGAPRRIGLGAGLYIGTIATLGLVLTAAAIRVDGITAGPTVVVLLLLAVLTWWTAPVVVEGRVRTSFSSIVLLSAMALLGPAGAGLVGVVMGPLQRGTVPLRARVYNTGQLAILGVLGGATYRFAGGPPDASELMGAADIVRHVGVPILVADVVQVLVNVVLLAGVIRLTDRVPMRVQAAGLLRWTGPAYVGYGIVAFLLVVLWQPAGLGAAAALLVLAPLLVARWAYRQYADELRAQERALHVLVAAVEAKAPHLAGHSARVAELSESMAEHLGLRPQVVTDTRLAGMLHDLGQTTLPTAVVRGVVDGSPGTMETYPDRGAGLLRGLSFLSGALGPIADHRSALRPDHAAASDIPSRIVGIADEFDRLTVVGTPEGDVLSPSQAVVRLRDSGVADAELARALESALARRAVVGGRP